MRKILENKQIFDEIKNLIEDYIVKEVGEFKTVKWILCDKSEFFSYYNGLLPNDIPFYINGYYNYKMSKQSGSSMTLPISWGILETIYDYGDYALGFIRNDMPFSYQIYTMIHAYIHAVIMKNHLHHKINYNIIKYYTDNVDIFSQEIEEFEKEIEKVNNSKWNKNGNLTNILHVSNIIPTNKIILNPNRFYDILLILGSLSASLLNNVLDLSQYESNSLIFNEYPPEDTQDILYVIYNIAYSKELKRIINIFRLREMYARTISPIKIFHEGLCTYYEEKIYEQVLYKIAEILKKHNINEDVIVKLLYSPIGKEHHSFWRIWSNVATYISTDGGYYKLEIKIILLLLKLFEIIRDPYRIGYLLFDYLFKNTDYNKENIYTLYDKNLISYLASEDFIEYFFNTHTIPKHDEPIVSETIKQLTRNDKLMELIKNVLFLFFYESHTRAFVPRDGYKDKVLKIVPIKSNTKEIKLSINDYDIDVELDKAIRVGNRKIKYIHFALDLSGKVKVNYDAALSEAIDDINEYIKYFLPIEKIQITYL